MPFSRPLPVLALALGLAVTPALAQAPAPFSDAQRTAIEAIIKDYLIKNPEVLDEAMAQLQMRRDAEQQKRQSQAVVDNKAAIYDVPQNEVIGNPKGDVTLVEFFDYNCGYCKHTLADVLKLADDDKNLRIILKDFPVLGPGSVEAAQVALGVKQQLSGDAFMRFHRELLATRGPVGRDRALDVAKASGVDMAKLAADTDPAKVRPALAKTLQLGDTLGINGTPSFVVGDELVVGAVGYDALKAKVDSVRRCGRTNCG